jgi:hypothetical protein
MNSRNAMNEISVNKITDPVPPVASAAMNTAVITHQERVRALRFATISRA